MAERCLGQKSRCFPNEVKTLTSNLNTDLVIIPGHMTSQLQD